MSARVRLRILLGHLLSALLVVMIVAAAATILTHEAYAQAPESSTVTTTGEPAPTVDGATGGPVGGEVPGGVRGNIDDSEMWRAIRQGESGRITLPNEAGGVLIQSEGEAWRAFRNGPLSNWGVWGLLGIIGLLALFFLLRGRIRIEHGRSERRILRFNVIERAAHWMIAVSFILLALTGLNVLYGRYVLLPLIGPEAFTAISIAGKYIHNYVAFPFMLGLVMIFVMWVVHNIPNRHDAVWLAKGGGMIGKGSHPPAKKFNAGQKIIFWLVILGGLSVSLSGIALLFPFQTQFFGGTFSMLNAIGFNLPENLSGMQEQQLNQVWHAIMGLFLTAVIIAHIYIGTIGMEGAFDAMGSGEVDYNWAREHHALWVEELEAKERGETTRPGAPPHHPAPAE